MFGILLHATVKMEKYLASIMDDSTIICDNDEKIRTVPSSFNEKKVPVKHKVFIFYLHFY